jgi:hypothetical protein
MDGLYWVDSVPGLKDFYVPDQAVVSGDKSAEINELTKEYTAKYGKPPASQYAYPIYAWLQEWAKAVTKAGTTEGKAVVAVMETYKDEPSILGPRTYTHKWPLGVAWSAAYDAVLPPNPQSDRSDPLPPIGQLLASPTPSFVIPDTLGQPTSI